MSISRVHAVIITDHLSDMYIIDLGSKCGTKVNDQPIASHTPVKLDTGMKLEFGLSSRHYMVKIDSTKVRKMYER